MGIVDRWIDGPMVGNNGWTVDGWKVIVWIEGGKDGWWFSGWMDWWIAG